MAKLTYPEAVKARKTAKEVENRMVIHIDARLVLPFKDGVQVMQALANAEKLGRWSSDSPIEPLDTNTIETTVMNAKRYEQHKIAVLMGVTVEDVVKAEQQAAEADNPTP